MAGRLYDTSKAFPDRFIRFLLAGHMGSGNQVFINSRQGAQSLAENDFVVMRDIDSAIGISKDLPFVVPIGIFPVPSFRDTLKVDNHVKFDREKCCISQAQVCPFYLPVLSNDH